jgi:hypothetical protein
MAIYRCNFKQIREWDVEVEADNKEDAKRDGIEMVNDAITKDCAGMDLPPQIDQHQKYYENIKTISIKEVDKFSIK